MNIQAAEMLPVKNNLYFVKAFPFLAKPLPSSALSDIYISIDIYSVF